MRAWQEAMEARAAEERARRANVWGWAYALACPSCKAGAGKACGAAKRGRYGDPSEPKHPHHPRILAVVDMLRRQIGSGIAKANEVRCASIVEVTDAQVDGDGNRQTASIQCDLKQGHPWTLHISVICGLQWRDK